MAFLYYFILFNSLCNSNKLCLSSIKTFYNSPLNAWSKIEAFRAFRFCFLSFWICFIICIFCEISSRYETTFCWVFRGGSGISKFNKSLIDKFG